MTARRRLLPQSEIRAALDLLKEYGVPVSECAIDIGPDGVKVSPPANSNTGDDLGAFINRNPPRPQKAGKR